MGLMSHWWQGYEQSCIALYYYWVVARSWSTASSSSSNLRKSLSSKSNISSKTNILCLDIICSILYGGFWLGNVDYGSFLKKGWAYDFDRMDRDPWACCFANSLVFQWRHKPSKQIPKRWRPRDSLPTSEIWSLIWVIRGAHLGAPKGSVKSSTYNQPQWDWWF